MNLKSKFSEIEAEARRMAARRNSLVMASEVTVIFILPITENILVQNMKELSGGGIFWPLMLLVGSVHVLLGFIVILPTRNEFFSFEFLDLKSKYESLERDFGRAAASGRVVYLTLKSARNFIGMSKSTSGMLSVENIRTYFAKLINTAVLNRDGVLGFSLSDRYSFIMYMYSENEESLKPFYCARDDRIILETRTWKLHQGPVGSCYANEKPEIIKDPERVGIQAALFKSERCKELSFRRSNASLLQESAGEEENGNRCAHGCE